MAKKDRFFQPVIFAYGRLVGLEPTSAGATIQCVNQLHHNRQVPDYNSASFLNMQEKNDTLHSIYADKYSG